MKLSQSVYVLLISFSGMMIAEQKSVATSSNVSAASNVTAITKTSSSKHHATNSQASPQKKDHKKSKSAAHASGEKITQIDHSNDTQGDMSKNFDEMHKNMDEMRKNMDKRCEEMREKHEKLRKEAQQRQQKSNEKRQQRLAEAHAKREELSKNFKNHAQPAAAYE